MTTSTAQYSVIASEAKQSRHREKEIASAQTDAPRNDKRDLIIVFGLALIVRVAVAAFQAQPGYMDAYYYTAGAQRLAGGFGFSDPYVWNYLDDPTSLPHPSHLYWMPLPSILAALSMALFGSSFRAAQAPFVLLASIAPIIAYVVAWRVTAQRRAAWIAAWLMIFSGFYIPFWGLPESFAPYAVFGSLALLLSNGRSTRSALAAGVCAGLAHLTRADGLLLLVPVLLNAELGMKNEGRPFLHSAFVVRRSSFVLLLGYLVVMLPWFLRNLAVVGSPLASAGMQTLWVCHYDEVFSFGVRLDVNHWLGCGIDRMAAAKLNGLASGLVHLIAENGLIFAAPFMAIGLWRLRRESIFRPVFVYLLLVYLAMTLAFTFVGDRGGLFHSSAALMPFLCAAAPVGLERIVEAAVRRIQAWQFERAARGFGLLIVVLALALSIVVFAGRVIAADWNRADAAYREVGAWLTDRGERDAVVMAGNPPGFTYHAGHPAIVLPNGDVETLLAAARRFGAKWVVLDQNYPQPLAALYSNPQLSPHLIPVATFGKTVLFEIGGK